MVLLLFIMDTPGCCVEDTGEGGISDAAFEEGVRREGAKDVIGNLGVGGTLASMDEGKV